jgi:hypothetical protein
MATLGLCGSENRTITTAPPTVHDRLLRRVSVPMARRIHSDRREASRRILRKMHDGVPFRRLQSTGRKVTVLQSLPACRIGARPPGAAACPLLSLHPRQPRDRRGICTSWPDDDCLQTSDKKSESPTSCNKHFSVLTRSNMSIKVTPHSHFGDGFAKFSCVSSWTQLDVFAQHRETPPERVVCEIPWAPSLIRPAPARMRWLRNSNNSWSRRSRCFPKISEPQSHYVTCTGYR